MNYDREERCYADVLKENPRISLTKTNQQMQKLAEEKRNEKNKKDTRLVERFSCDVVPGRCMCVSFFLLLLIHPYTCMHFSVYMPRHLCVRLFGVLGTFCVFSF